MARKYSRYRYKKQRPTVSFEAAMEKAVEALVEFKAAKKNEMNKKTIWLKEDESITGVFRGVPYEYEVHWVDKKKKTCFGSSCDFCSAGLERRFQFRVNFVHKNSLGEVEASIFEDNEFTYNDLSRFNETTPVDLNVIKISKVRDGKYLKNRFEKVADLSVETLKQIELVTLCPLIEQPTYADAPSPNDDIPF